ncbi:BfmA/BtgA family mobilization protein [Capnocytophaga stomatis]|uniref:BfmA/BtgA family mobilization protein n=1 Tax=Capnocytophaga stomatis TaxID=1848904 RepID=UPI0019507CCF|nr:BfmA/BtgA family mobilization protein [Capnocytophaga stomatis]
MEKKTIVLNLEVHKKVEETKEKFSFKTYNDLIKSMCYFFENNKVSPSQILEENTTEIFRSDIRMYFDDLRKIQKEDNQGLRKFIGALEKNYLKPIINKLEMEDVVKAVELSKPEKETPPALESLVKEQSSETDHLKSQISEIRNAKNEALDLAEKYKNMLKQLMTKIKVENNILGTKECQIKMSVSEYEEFKKSTGLV